MRLLIINPNTSSDVTELIRAEAQRSAGPDTELRVETAPYGVEYIETRFESLLAAGAVAEMIATHAGEVDGIVVAAFGDPGMPALKELVDVPVIGITEAALCAAALQGHRFSIIAISDRITAWYRECVESFVWRAPPWALKAADGSQWTVNEGDWLIGIRWSPQAWELLKTGKVHGVSMQGYAERRAASPEGLARVRARRGGGSRG